MQIDRTTYVTAGLSAAFVESWAAVIPASDEMPMQRLGDCAPETDIPAGLRRRLGPLARMGVACGLGVAPDGDADIVYCSRYGDIALAHQLLTSLVTSEPMSPAGFSMSVHNAVPGVIDLARKAHIGHTAVAAGPDTLSAGLAEAWLRLGERPHLKLVLVFADLPLPEAYRSFADFEMGGIALALRLSAGPGGHVGNSLIRLSGVGESEAVLDTPHAEGLARELVARLQGGASAPLRWRAQGSIWSFGRNSDAAP